MRLTPAAVLEDVASREMFAIFPASWKVVIACESIGVEVVEGEETEHAED